MIHYRKRLETLYLATLPATIMLLLTIVFLTSKHINGISQFMPLLPVLSIFYSGVAQARDLPYSFIFLLGLVIDSVTGLPLGITSLTYIFFLLIILTQRKYIHKEGFVIKWGFFAGLLAIANLSCWGLLSLFYSQLQPTGWAFFQWFLTVCCYPFFHKIMDHVYEYIQARRWQILHGL
jgi:rod shape-determining protein MreD